MHLPVECTDSSLTRETHHPSVIEQSRMCVELSHGHDPGELQNTKGCSLRAWLKMLWCFRCTICFQHIFHGKPFQDARHSSSAETRKNHTSGHTIWRRWGENHLFHPTPDAGDPCRNRSSFYPLLDFLFSGMSPPNDPLFLGRSTWGQILASQMLRHFASKPRLHQLGPIHTTSSCRKIFEYYEYLILLAHQWQQKGDNMSCDNRHAKN